MERGEKAVMRIESPEQAKENPAYYQALTDLLYQLADDDLLISFRGAEWLGLAPHIEADLAYSSITQNTMGNASMYYHLIVNLCLVEDQKDTSLYSSHVSHMYVVYLS